MQTMLFSLSQISSNSTYRPIFEFGNSVVHPRTLPAHFFLMRKMFPYLRIGRLFRSQQSVRSHSERIAKFSWSHLWNSGVTSCSAMTSTGSAGSAKSASKNPPKRASCSSFSNQTFQVTRVNALLSGEWERTEGAKVTGSQREALASVARGSPEWTNS